jgi:hypothetical protein
MRGQSKPSTLCCGNQRRARETPKNLRYSRLSLFLAVLCLLAVLFTPLIAFGQDTEEIKGTPAEPADAQQIAAQRFISLPQPKNT